VLGLILICACGARGGSRQAPASGPPVIAGSAPPAPPPRLITSAPTPAASAAVSTTAPAVPPPEPIPKHRFEPAQRFIAKSKLTMYRYHQRRVGNVDGYFAPIVLTGDGGFLVVGTREDFPGGKFQVGKSRPVVAKLDAAGSLTWERAYRTTGFLDYEGASAAELEDGYVVYVLSYVHPARGAVVRLLRLDRKGGVVWDLKLRGQGRENTPFAQDVRLHQGQIFLDGHIYKDSSDTAYGWQGTVSLGGKLLSDDVGGANPYGKH
jgi:hypothetical protein